MKGRRNINVIKLFLIGCCMSVATNFPSGFTNSSINTAVESLSHFINDSYLTRNVTCTIEDETFIRSVTLNCWFVGQIFGALIAPTITDNYGRKVAYIVSSIGMLLATALQYAASILMLPELLIVGRSLAALGTPLSDAALVLYLQESTPINLRGSFSFLCDIGYSIMCLLGMVLGMRAVLGHSLQCLLAVSVIPQFFSVTFLLFIPETPKYLMITRGARAKALKSLEFFQGSKIDNENILNQYGEESGDTNIRTNSSAKEIFFTWHLRQALILSIMILIQTLAFYPVLQSSTYFFEQANLPNTIAELSSTVLMVLYAASTALGVPLIDRFSHRTLLLIFGTIANLALFVFAVASLLANAIYWMRFVCFMAIGIYIMSYGTILGPMSWFIGPSLAPQRQRARILCYAHVICEIMISFTNFLCVYFYTSFSAAIFVPLFVVPSTVSIVYIYFYLPETRNCDTDVIVKLLQMRKNLRLQQTSNL